ncbi:transposon Tf2-9 polyprotein [Trichonephila inaurata madagascariensis]|uniref:Transposon Tf2-9 polyprotein n=1 Tax=Trichonephila inaurata madagascariensis TaxID=2747483 RepID=A0A8X6XUS1_9ARAC|nr:transposon Tf2-9 polyprotein [Trichonephila inaurata madagascariensis]
MCRPQRNKQKNMAARKVNAIEENGLEACRELGLIQRLNMIYKSPTETPGLILKDFADVFTDFQKAMDEIYDEDINPYFDDIAMVSSTVEEHCRLRQTLLKARKANLKLNELKKQLSQTSVNYLGHVLSDEGIKPDPKKIRALKSLQHLTAKKIC